MDIDPLQGPTVNGVAGSASVLFWTYDPAAPSYRHRLAPAAAALRQAGWRVETDRLPRGRYLTRLLARRRSVAAAHCLVLGKIKLTAGEWGLVRSWPTPAVLDLDDAIWLRKPRGPERGPEAGWWRRMKFDRTCAACDLVLVGNSFLADHARRNARRVEVVPTSVELSASRAAPGEGMTVVWIGLPENLMYLEIVRPALERLARRHPRLRLRVVSSAAPEWTAPAVEPVPWTADGEVAALASADLGIMPLTDDDWSRGKCAFKILQYMAAGLPVVASPVGANLDAVVDGETGFLARTSADWERAVERLLLDPGLARRMGDAGRRLVAARYGRARVAATAAGLISSVVQGYGRR